MTSHLYQRAALQPAGFTFVRACDPLLEDSTAKVSVDEPRLRVRNRGTQDRILDTMLPGEAHNHLVLKTFTCSLDQLSFLKRQS